MALRHKKCEEYLISVQKNDRCHFSCKPSYAIIVRPKIKLLFLSISQREKDEACGQDDFYFDPAKYIKQVAFY